ncbi:unnamed protein product [Psylliodes chrysocephalus]|uniref:DUF7869 domain-containing protein n=1 Tax=Psylliodes chrysocephalus TaxID=3402493 RepID=A0A9P0CK66_9CUCU|nr:unnamed protein product [Psylliodes chrysocephala]
MNRGKKILALVKQNEQQENSAAQYPLENLPIEFEDGVLFEGDSTIMYSDTPNDNIPNQSVISLESNIILKCNTSVSSNIANNDISLNEQRSDTIENLTPSDNYCSLDVSHNIFISEHDNEIISLDNNIELDDCILLEKYEEYPDSTIEAEINGKNEKTTPIERTPNKIEDSLENVNHGYETKIEKVRINKNVMDPDFVLNNSKDNEESDSEVVNKRTKNRSQNEDLDPEDMSIEPATKRAKKIDLDKNKWKRTENKIKRMKGEEYLGYTRKNKKWKHNKIRSEREIKERCDGKHCGKTKVYLCNSVTNEKRNQIFENFWKDLTWDQKKMFVINNVEKTEPKRRKTENKETQKSNSFFYYLRIDGKPLRVCKKMFLNTLCIGEWSVRNWCNNEDNGMVASSAEVNDRRKNSQEPKLCERRKFLENWFDKLPKIPSHYARADSKKEYIEDNIVKNKSQLYKRYVECCEGKPLSTFVFDELFEKKNLGIFQPRKDQCDMCCSFKTGNIDQKEYEAHIVSKDRARIEKQIDKEQSSIKENCHLLTMDLQAVQLCPRMYASALYYKQKLRVHNFTIYNLSTHQSTNFWWHECEGKLEASNFASCIIDYLETQFSQSNLPIIIYSDGCGYQNKNAVLSNALLTFSVTNKKIVEQKYLVRGHTQMECDSVHSLIERRLEKREIYLPGEYVSITKHARKNPFPLDAKYLHHDFFKYYSDPLFQWYSSIRPPGATVSEIRALKYTPEGLIYFKTDFDSDYMPLRKTKSVSLNRVNYKNLYSTKPKISLEKYEQLLAITKVMDTDYHDFYKNLPHAVSKKIKV